MLAIVGSQQQMTHGIVSMAANAVGSQKRMSQESSTKSISSGGYNYYY
jgi:hypothetical protein